MGATLDSVMKSENSRAAATPDVRSAATARASTIPPPPAKPCTKRQAVKAATDGARGTQQRRDLADGGRTEQQAPAAPGIRQRAQHQLADHQTEHVRGESELHLRLGGVQVGGELGKRRQVEVHGQRAEGREAAQQHGYYGEPPSGDRLRGADRHVDQSWTGQPICPTACSGPSDRRTRWICASWST